MRRWIVIVISLWGVPAAHAYRPFEGTTYTPGSVVNYGIADGWDRATAHLDATGFDQREHELGGFVSVIGEGPGDRAVRPVAELLIAHEGDSENEASALAGVIWQKHKDLSFDGAVVLEHESGAFGVGVRLGFASAVAI